MVFVYFKDGVQTKKEKTLSPFSTLITWVNIFEKAFANAQKKRFLLWKMEKHVGKCREATGKPKTQTTGNPPLI